MSWKEVSEEMEKIEKIVGQMEEGTEEETDKQFQSQAFNSVIEYFYDYSSDRESGKPKKK